MSTPPHDHPFLHNLKAEVEAELDLAESSLPADGDPGPAAEWQFDPTDVQREEAGLRSLLGALDAVDHDPGQDPA